MWVSGSTPCTGVRRNLFRRGARLTFCKFRSAVMVRTFFWRSMLSVLYQGIVFTTTSKMAKKTFNVLLKGGVLT